MDGVEKVSKNDKLDYMEQTALRSKLHKFSQMNAVHLKSIKQARTSVEMYASRELSQDDQRQAGKILVALRIYSSLRYPPEAPERSRGQIR